MVLESLIPDSTLGQVIIIILATGLIWLGSGWLEEAAEKLATYYGLPPVIQGSVVVAIGSSFPELASVVITALAGSFGMGVGAIVGSAIFNILVIPGLSGLFTEDALDSSRTIVYKEAQFYMIAVAGLLITMALSIIYYPVPETPELVGNITRPLAAIPLFLYGLYVFIQWQDISDHEAGDTTIDGNIAYEWARLAGGLIAILIAVEALVKSVEAINATFGIPAFIGGVIIISAATSIPDSIVSIRAARHGKAATSIGNVLGSNTFDLLVAIPIGVLIAGAAPVSFTLAAPMMGILTLATVLLFVMLRTGLKLTQTESYMLLTAYTIFAIWIIGETIGYFNILAPTAT